MKVVSAGDDIAITITDNGPGLAEDLLDKLKRGEIGVKGSGIGLLNIDERIKLLFGPEYGVSPANAPGGGAQVALRIPKVKAGDVDV